MNFKISLLFLSLVVFLIFVPYEAALAGEGGFFKGVIDPIKNSFNAIQKKVTETAQGLSKEVSSGFLERQKQKTIVIWDRMITKAERSIKYFFTNTTKDAKDKIITPLKNLIQEGSGLAREKIGDIREYISGWFK